MTPMIARGVSDAQQDQLMTAYLPTRSRACSPASTPSTLVAYPLVTTADNLGDEHTKYLDSRSMDETPASEASSRERVAITPSAMTVLAGAPPELAVGTYVESNEPVVVPEKVRSLGASYVQRRQEHGTSILRARTSVAPSRMKIKLIYAPAPRPAVRR